MSKKGYSQRRSGNRKQTQLLIIVCEGKKTERSYFTRYRERKSGLKIVTPNSSVTDPVNLVDFALSQIRRYDPDLEGGDAIWCVFDADHHTEQEIEKTKRKAGTTLKVCLSNPCFELWYLLHFCYSENRISNRDLTCRLKKHLPDYEKNKDYFDKLIGKRQTAIDGSKRLNKWHTKNSIALLSAQSNPSTQVFELVEYILETIAKNKAD